jgi:hypothetical protein
MLISEEFGHRYPCGSELARDSSLVDNVYVECKTAIASKLAPTGSAP